MANLLNYDVSKFEMYWSHSISDTCILMMVKIFSFWSISLDVGRILKFWKRHMKALKKCLPVIEFVFWNFLKFHQKNAKNCIFRQNFHCFCLISIYNEIFCKIFLRHWKERPKSFQNHYNFLQLCQFLTEKRANICRKLHIFGSFCRK